MGINYISGWIDDGKLFGIIWIIFEKIDLDIEWLIGLLEIIIIFVIKFVLFVWVVFCFKKVKMLWKDGLFGVLSDNDIEKVVKWLFYDIFV